MLKTIPESECSCSLCVAACKRPCWPTPAEVLKLIEAGFAKQLMLDYWHADENISILCPANPGYEGCSAPEISIFDILSGYNPLKSGCIFLEDKKCKLHDLKLKPIEGRLTLCCQKQDGQKLHKAVADTWDTDEGRNVVAQWEELIYGRKIKKTEEIG